MVYIKLPSRWKQYTFYLLIFLFASNLFAKTGQWTYGASLGLGGTGIRTYSEIDGVNTKIERSESPGAFSLFADRTINDFWTASFEHIRGFRFGPFSSGLTFTGVGTKWYFWTPAPTYSEVTPGSSHLLVKQLTPFIGVATGIASGSIQRANDKVPSVHGSGIYIGGRSGFDYTLEPGFGIRSEGSLSFTFTYAEKPSTTLAEFSLRIGIFYYY